MDETGDKMAYRVAMDAVPEGKARQRRRNVQVVDGRPPARAAFRRAFIVAGDGKIYWIGHPMEMDEAVEKIASGSWDLKTAIAEQSAPRKRPPRKWLKSEKSRMTSCKAVQSGDAKKVIAAADAAIEHKPMFEMFVGPMKLAALIKLDEQDKALEYGKKLLGFGSRQARTRLEWPCLGDR